MARITTETPRMRFADAVSSCFKKYATFKGRARRSEFWWWQLFYCLISLLSPIPFVGNLFVLAILLPSLAVSARRLHDIGRSGWWLLLPCCTSLAVVALSFCIFFLEKSSFDGPMPIIMWCVMGLIYLIVGVVFIVWFIQDSQREPNQYGPSPKYIEEETSEEVDE